MIIEFIFPTSTIYVTEEFSDRVYIEDVIVNVSGEGGGGGGVTDHGLLTGLADDDHTQYLTQARGDARYYTETEVDTLLSGKANTSHTHIIGDVTGLQTALDGKASTSHTHIIGDVTGLQTALDGKAATSHTHIIADVTGLQTALDGKAASSHTHVKADITDFAHTHPQSDITNLTTDLAGKQATLVSGTNIKTVNSESLLGSGNIVVSSPPKLLATEMLKAIGLSIIAESFGRSRPMVTTAVSFADNQTWWAPVYLAEAATITGIGFLQGTSGVFTADNENAIALYSLSAGTFTKVATTANNGDIWKGTANTEQRVALTTPYVAAAGVYWVVSIYNQSAQTTAPSVGAYPTMGNSVYSSSGFSGGGRTAGFISAQTALAATYAGATVTNTANQLYFFLY